MTSWRMDLAVLTDLSASMFAAVFMMLLIFLSLAQEKDRGRAPSEPAVVDAGALRIVRRSIPAPSDMVDLLRLHGHPTATDVGIDVFNERVEIFSPGGEGPAILPPSAIEAGLARALAAAGEGTVRLYVFSNRLYNQLVPVLERMARPSVEITVPQALRDPGRPGSGWSEAFLHLGARRLGPEAFRQQLAVLLAGRAEPALAAGRESSARAHRPAGGFASTEVRSSLLDRLKLWLRMFTTVVTPALGLACVVWIERRRIWI